MSFRSILRVVDQFFNIKIPFKLILDWVHSMVKKLEIDVEEERKKEKSKTIKILKLDENKA